MSQPRSFIFATVARGAFFVLNVFALYLLLRGHNLPGGGFIAGLVTAISIIMLSLALGWEAIHRVLRFDPVRLATLGLALAAVTGAAPLLWGRPFLEHFMAHVNLPLLGEVHAGTALGFDTGVFFVVVGITCKILFVLGKSTEGLRALVREEESRYAAPVEEPIEESAEDAPPETRKEEPRAD
jgi:multisubunit Na+/H+ antiporter MnhB subunit